MSGQTAIRLPTGLVTFLITDIEGSTELLQLVGNEVFAATIERHNRILHASISAAGTVVRVTGDSFFAVFTDPLAAVSAAVAAQRGLAAETWPEAGDVRIRVGLHTGEGLVGGEDYVGLDVHRAARISSAGHGGQILLSGETARRVAERLPADVSLREMGRHRLKDLSQPEELYQLVISGLPDEFAPIHGLETPAENLPEEVTSFVGRSQQIEEITHLLGHNRLVTLTGPGGSGKTRLSIRVAASCAERFSDGTFFVALESISDGALVPVAVLKSLNRLPSGPIQPAEHLLSYLADKQLLLVLDNYEQLLPETSLVAEVLKSAPGVAMVVTSRAPLHLSGEQEYPVPPLPSPMIDGAGGAPDIGSYESVELFVQRATAVKPDFRLTDENAQPIAELAARLEGLPLAIELAASRVRLLTPREILGRLSNRLLANVAPDVPARQQTITNAVEWSYDLLDLPTKSFFERLSVFRGGATFRVIEEVCDPEGELGIDSLDALSGLVDHSLVEANPTAKGSRYQMLAVVREFAENALSERGELEMIRDRHLEVLADLATRAEPLLLTSQRGKWLDILTEEHDNLRAAHDWAVETSATDSALGMVANLWRFWQQRGHLTEGQSRIEKALAMAGGSAKARAMGLEALGGVLYWKGEWESSSKVYLESLELVRGYGSPLELAHALYNASFPIKVGGQHEEARQYLEESLAISEVHDDRVGVGRAFFGLCDSALLGGDLKAALHWARKAEREFDGLDAPFDIGWTRFMIAHASYLGGDPASAREYVDSALSIFIEARDLSAMVLIMHVKARVLEVEGEALDAARLLGALEVLIEEIGVGIVEVEAVGGAYLETAEERYQPVSALKDSTDPEIQSAMEMGRALSVEAAIEMAIST